MANDLPAGFASHEGSVIMPVFATPQHLTVTLELAIADVRFIASERRDTSVEVRPANSSSDTDIKAAQQTVVEYANGRLLIKGPRPRFHLFRSESVTVTIELPAGSDVYGNISMGDFRAEGCLGECQFQTSYGSINIEQASTLNLNTNYGSITVERVTGHADVSTGSGRMRIGQIDGPATIKNSDGSTTIREVMGELRFNAANGDLAVGRALNSVTAKTAHGNVQIDEVVRGAILLETAYGRLEVGIGKGVAAWLDVSTKYGKVRNSLNPQEGPGQSDETVEVRGRTAYGDIIIHRSNLAKGAKSYEHCVIACCD